MAAVLAVATVLAAGLTVLPNSVQVAQAQTEEESEDDLGSKLELLEEESGDDLGSKLALLLEQLEESQEEDEGESDEVPPI